MEIKHKDRVKDYLALPFSTRVVPDVTTDNEPCYLAYHPELEGCMSHGATPEEALCNLAEVTELYISALLEKGLEIPRPQGTRVSWDIFESGIGQAEADTYIIMPSVTPPVFSPAGY